MAQLKSTTVTGNLTVTGKMLASEIIKLNGTAYEVLLADGTVAKVSTTAQNVAPNAVTDTAARTYIVQKNGDQLVVNVPWVKGESSGGTLTEVNLVGGGGITLSSNTIGSDSDSITISHTDTSSQASMTTGGRTYVNSITLDAYGHVTALGTNTETVTDTGATSVEVTGTGNAITAASYDASTRKITLTKGSTFLTSHQSLADYVKGPSSSTNMAIAVFDGTGGKTIKESGATIDANRNLKFSGPGNISWEDGSYHQRIKITDDSTVNTAVFTFQQTEDTGTNWNDLFTIQDRGTIIAKNSTGGALSLTLDRGANANWRWLSDNGNFLAQCDYTTAKGNYFNVLTMSYNSGNVSIDKGTLTSKGGFIHGNLTAASGKTKNDYILLAGGGTKALADFGLSNNTSFNPSDYQPKDDDLTAIAGLAGTSGFLKKTAANTWTLDTTTYSTFSGSYNDLTNKPTIPAAQIQSDWNQTSTTALDYIKNKPTIPTVPNNVVTGSGLTANNVIVGNGNSTIKDSGISLSTKGNAAAKAAVVRPNPGEIHSEKYVITEGETVRASWSYNATTQCVELAFRQ